MVSHMTHQPVAALRSGLKLKFHGTNTDTDTNTDFLADFLALFLAKMSVGDARMYTCTGCANKKQSRRKNSVFQPWEDSFEPNFVCEYSGNISCKIY